MTQTILRLGLTALALSSIVVAQASVAVPVSIPINNATVRFGDASTLAAAFTPAFAIGVFDSDLPSPPVTVISSTAGVYGSWNSIHWERSTGTPQRVFAVATGSAFALPTVQAIPTTPPFSPIQLIGSVALGTPAATTQWQLDAVASTNNVFFLRSTLTGQVRRLTTNGTGIPYATAPAASGPMRLSPNNLTIAYASGAQLVRLDANNTGAAPVVTTVPNIVWGGVSQAPTIRGLHWIDDRFLVALIGPVSTPGAIGQVARIDTAAAPPAVEFLTMSLSGTIQPFMSELSISGDRNWVTFMVEQSVQGTFERSPVVMRVSDLVTTNPGGSYIVIEPLGFGSPATWVSIREPRVQQRAGLNLSPLVLFEGRPTAPPSATTLFRAGVVRDPSITGRATLGVTLTLASRSSTDDVAFGLFGDLARSPAPITIPGVINPGFLPNPIALLSGVTTPNTDTFVPLTMPSSGATGQRIFYQLLWLSAPPSGGTTLTASRVIELPVF